MGMVKRRMGNEAVVFRPEQLERVRTQVCSHLVRLGGLSLDATQRIYERSFVAQNLVVRPGPIIHEDPEYLAELILEREGIFTKEHGQS